MKLRKNEPAIVKSEMPHYYELKFKDHPNGIEKVHCGTMKDVERMLEMHPDAIYSKILLPHPPETVEVQQNLLKNLLHSPHLKLRVRRYLFNKIFPNLNLKNLNYDY